MYFNYMKDWPKDEWFRDSKCNNLQYNFKEAFLIIY